MSLLNAYHSRLVKIIDEEADAVRGTLLEGMLGDISQYKYQVGFLHGLTKLREFSEEAMSAVNKGE